MGCSAKRSEKSEYIIPFRANMRQYKQKIHGSYFIVHRVQRIYSNFFLRKTRVTV